MLITLPEIKLNPDIDLEQAAIILKENGRVQIHNFFTDETAERLLELIMSNKTWYLSYNEGDQFLESSLTEFNALAPQFKQRMMNNIYQRAASAFQYVFIQYYITQAVKKGEEKGNPIHLMHEFVNGDLFMPFMKALTGQDEITWIESFVSRYAPGHFLTNHDDTHYKNDRVIAYTIGMSKNWSKDWGGHLAFFDEKGNVDQAFIPSFNTLSVFAIPQPHAVQMVAPYAKGERLSFLGWANR